MQVEPVRGRASALTRDESMVLGGLVALFVITAAWWALAFWPVEAAPIWLERTRYVCFGVRENGLPDGGGWIGLVGGPLGMLVILTVGWLDGVRALLHRARRSRAVAAALLLLFAGSIMLVSGAATRVRQVRATPAEYVSDVPPATYPRLDRPAPTLQLQSQDGRLRNLQEFAGRVTLITFAYAHCTTVCPVVVRHVLDAQEQLSRAGGRPVVLVLTLDPWRDTPSRLPEMARSWGLPTTDAFVLGGSVEDVERTLDAWGVPRTRDLTTGEVVHPALTYVVDGDGRIAYATNGNARSIVSLVERL